MVLSTLISCLFLQIPKSGFYNFQINYNTELCGALSLCGPTTVRVRSAVVEVTNIFLKTSNIFAGRTGRRCARSAATSPRTPRGTRTSCRRCSWWTPAGATRLTSSSPTSPATASRTSCSVDSSWGRNIATFLTDKSEVEGEIIRRSLK